MTRTTTTTTTHPPEDMQYAVFEITHGLWTRVLYRGTCKECIDYSKDLRKSLTSEDFIILSL